MQHLHWKYKLKVEINNGFGKIFNYFLFATFAMLHSKELLPFWLKHAKNPVPNSYIIKMQIKVCIKRFQLNVITFSVLSS